MRIRSFFMLPDQSITNIFCPILFSYNSISWTESVNKVITTCFCRIASSGPIVFFECDGGFINIYCCLQFTGVITPIFIFVSWLNSFAKNTIAHYCVLPKYEVFLILDLVSHFIV